MAISGSCPSLALGIIGEATLAASGTAQSGFAGALLPEGTRAISVTARGGIVSVKRAAAATASFDIASGDTHFITIAGGRNLATYITIVAGTADVLAHA